MRLKRSPGRDTRFEVGEGTTGGNHRVPPLPKASGIPKESPGEVTVVRWTDPIPVTPSDRVASD